MSIALYKFTFTIPITITIITVTQDSNGKAQTWSVCNKGITQFHLPPTYEPFLVCTPSRMALPPLWLLLIAPTQGMARLRPKHGTHIDRRICSPKCGQRRLGLFGDPHSLATSVIGLRTSAPFNLVRQPTGLDRNTLVLITRFRRCSSRRGFVF